MIDDGLQGLTAGGGEGGGDGLALEAVLLAEGLHCVHRPPLQSPQLVLHGPAGHHHRHRHVRD